MEFDELDHLYGETILDHCRNPRNRCRLQGPDIAADGVNPFCGDEVHLQISVDRRRRVAGVGLQGEGCSINLATGSMLTEMVKGKTLEEIDVLANLFRRMMNGDTPSDAKSKELGNLEALAGVRQFPVRIKCALLAWGTLEEGIEAYRAGQATSAVSRQPEH